MMEAFDRAGITAAFMEPEEGGFIVGPKNLALSLAAFELAWVDGGAATASLAGFLALAPIHERGTPEQVARYKISGRPAAARRRSQALARSLRAHRAHPLRRRRYRHVERQSSRRGVERRRRALAASRQARPLHHQHRLRQLRHRRRQLRRPRIKGSCVVILEEGDEGIFDRGTATKKLVHQLSSTGDPIFNLQGSRQPHRRRLHRQGRRHRSQLQPQRNHRSRLPAHARPRRPDDRGQAAVGRRAGDSLPARSASAVPRAQSPARFATSKAFSSAKTRCTGWWMCGPPAKPPPRWALPPRACSTSSIPLEKQKTAILKKRGVQGGRAEMKALKRERTARHRTAVPASPTIHAAPNSKPIRWCNTS